MVSSRAITYPQRALVCGAGTPPLASFRGLSSPQSVWRFPLCLIAASLRRRAQVPDILAAAAWMRCRYCPYGRAGDLRAAAAGAAIGSLLVYGDVGTRWMTGA